jgi:hypothetical protein
MSRTAVQAPLIGTAKFRVLYPCLDHQASRLRQLVKNNLALNLRDSPAEVWLLGPTADDLVKNNLALIKILGQPRLRRLAQGEALRCVERVAHQSPRCWDSAVLSVRYSCAGINNKGIIQCRSRRV